MISRLNRENIAYIVTAILVVILPLNYRYIPPLMIILVILWGIENYGKYNLIFKNNANPKVLLFAFLIFYCWQCITLLYSADVKTGWQNAFERLSIIVFPIIFFSPVSKIRNNTNNLLKLFVLATVIFITICFINAFIKSFNIKNVEFEGNGFLYSTDFSILIHPSYLAMYVLISVFIAFDVSFTKSSKIVCKVLWVVIGIYLLISLYFISSRASIIAAIFMVLFYLINRIIKFRQSRYTLAGLLILFIVVLPYTLKNERVNNLMSRLSSEDEIKFDQIDERIVIWKSAISVIEENLFFGVGIGDTRSELVNEYKKRGEDSMARDRYNAHNQYLEAALEGGVIELVVFLSLLGIMVYIALSESNMLYGLFIIMMIVFFMFEAILYRLAGVSFFSLFSFLLIHANNQATQGKIVK